LPHRAAPSALFQSFKEEKMKKAILAAALAAVFGAAQAAENARLTHFALLPN